MPLDPSLDPVFDAAGQIYNVDPTHLKAIAQAESAGDANAVSRKGALGVMQLMPDTAKDMGVINPLDPVDSIFGGARYYSQALDKYGDPNKALEAYHGGIGNEGAWGPATQAYPGLVGSAYRQVAGTTQPNGIAALAGSGPPPGMTINPAAVQWAQQRTQGAAAVGERPAQWIDDLSRMMPGVGVLSPEYEGQKAAATKAGGNLQTIGPGGVVQNMPGAVGAEAEKAGAISKAQQQEKIEITRDGGIYKGGTYIGHAPKMTTIVDAEGNKYTAFTPTIGEVAPGIASVGGTPPTPNAAIANVPAGPTPPAGAGPTPPAGAIMNAPEALGPQQTHEMEVTGTELGKQRQENIDMQAHAQTQNALLKQMKLDIGSFPQGPLGPLETKAQQYLRYIDPSFNQSIATAEEFNKNAGIILRQAVHDTSSRAAVQEFKLIGDTLPSQPTSPLGTERVLNQFIGLNDYLIAKGQAQKNWLADPAHRGSVSGFEPDWQSKVSPDAFLMYRMRPDDAQEVIGKLQATDGGRSRLATLRDQMQYLKATGLERAIQ